MKTAADDPTRELLQQRFDEIDDALRDVNAERERLKNLFGTVVVSNHHRPLRQARETGSAGVFLRYTVAGWQIIEAKNSTGSPRP